MHNRPVCSQALWEDPIQTYANLACFHDRPKLTYSHRVSGRRGLGALGLCSVCDLELSSRTHRPCFMCTGFQVRQPPGGCGGQSRKEVTGGEIQKKNV